MKKIFTLLFLIATCVLAMQAQKRYVVAFDCTKSMDHPSGDYSDNGKDPSILWTPAKNCIKSLWKQAAPNDEFVILKETEKDGESYLATIDSDEEYDRIGKAFLERFSMIFDGEEEE